MSSVELATLDGSENTPPVPVGMVSHLKHLIESLPVCVMRTDMNGCLLAANDSALQLLGVTDHAKVLTKSLSERISAEHTEDWRAFLQRTWTEGAGSLECELIDFSGAHRIILVKSVAQPTHVDGIQSLILTVQDLASRRRLERALNEHLGCATTIDALQTELQKSESERQRLAALLETSQPQTSPASEDVTSAAWQQQIDALQATLAAKEKEWEQRTNEHRRDAELAADREVEHQALSDALHERLNELERSAAAKDEEWQKRLDQREAEHNAASDRLQQRITDLEHSLKAGEQEWQKRSDDLTATLAEHAAARLQLTNALAERDADHRSAGDSLRQRAGELEQSLKISEENLKTAEQHLKAIEEQWRKRCDELTAQLADAAAEREHVSKLLDQRSTEQRAAGNTLQQRIDELERTLKIGEESWQKERGALSTELVTHLTEQERLSAVLKQREDEHRRVSASLKQLEDEHKRLSELLKQREEEHQGLSASLQQRDEEYGRQGELLKQLEQERQQLSESLTHYEQEHRQLSDSLQQRERERQELSELLKQKDSERQQLSDLLKQREAEQQKLADLLKRRDADHQAAVEAFHQQIVEFERALAASDDSWKGRCEELSAELTAKDQERTRRWEELAAQVREHAAERQRLSAELQQREIEQQRLIDRHETEKVRIEQSVRGECDRAQACVEETRRLEIDGLRHDIRQLVDDLQGTAAQLDQRTDEYDRVMKEVTAHADPGAVIDPADVERLMKSVAAYRIELVQVTENTIRTLEPMATAGRVAVASSRELRAAVEAVDARSRQLLEQCALDDVNRTEIERLRRDSIGAASLVRQLLQVFGESTRLAGRADENAGGETS